MLPHPLRRFYRALRVLLHPLRPLCRAFSSVALPFPTVESASVIRPLAVSSSHPHLGTSPRAPPFIGFDSIYRSLVGPTNSAPPLIRQTQPAPLVPVVLRPQVQVPTHVAMTQPLHPQMIVHYTTVTRPKSRMTSPRPNSAQTLSPKCMSSVRYSTCAVSIASNHSRSFHHGIGPQLPSSKCDRYATLSSAYLIPLTPAGLSPWTHQH